LRAEITSILAPWFAERDLATVTTELTAARVLSAPYRTLTEAAAALEGPLRLIDQPGIGEVVSSGSPIRWADYEDVPRPAAALGSDTRDVLMRLAGMSATDVDTLVSEGIAAGGEASS
jgi:2-methylfumaryl-CoA isomerase